MSLDQLLRALQDGEPRAQHRLFRRLRNELLPFFKKRVHTPDAEDLTQEALAVVAKRLQAKHFEPEKPSSFRSFAFVIAHYLLLGFYRTQRRRPPSTTWWNVPESSDESASADDLVMVQEQSALFHEEMALIKSAYRRALESRLRDEDPSAFAETEGVEVATVRKRISRALALISAKIEARRRTARVPTPI